MKRPSTPVAGPAGVAARLPLPALLLALALSQAGCSTIEGWFSDKADYKGAGKVQPLEVPPDLTQLQRESRYQLQGGVISASTAGSTQGANNAPAGGPTVAVTSQGAVRVERDGQQRWLVSPQTPEQLWPLLRDFWAQNGFTLASENAAIGVMETNWGDSSVRLPNTGIRGTLTRIIGSMTDSGERDRFRIRVERTATGSEVYIAHRAAEEVWIDERHENTNWVPRPSDPQKEAEFLSRLMIALGGVKPEPARAAVAAATPAAATLPAKVSVTSAGATATSLVLDEPFDRAWRRVGVALDRGGFTVEDRDRASGIYYVRYVDPKYAGKDEPAWYEKLFRSGPDPMAPVRYRVVLKPNAEKTNLSVQNATGAPDTGDNAKRIVGLLMTELR